MVVLKVSESKQSVLNDILLNSSKITCRISETSCWELKLKGALWVDEISHLSAQREFEGSMCTADFSLIAIFGVTDFSNVDNCANSTEEVLQSNCINLNACKMVLA